MISGNSSLLDVCRAQGVLACYLFGSRADDGMELLEGKSVDRQGSDLDVGVLFESVELPHPRVLVRLQVALEDVFAPLRVDQVPLDRVDPLFQYAAICGHRVADLDTSRTSRIELRIMRTAAELLPIQRGLEREHFGSPSS